MQNYFTSSSPLRKSLDESKPFDFYAFFARKQNLSIFTCVFLVAFIAVFVSIIFTQYKANPCSPFSRVMIEKTVFAGNAHAYLTNLTRKFGPRMQGSQSLAQFIDWMADEMHALGLQRIVKEQVMVPVWVRGPESCAMVAPFAKTLGILGLGGTVSCNLTAPAVVVTSLEDLEEKKDQVMGKIVVFNQEWAGYNATVQYRTQGPRLASQLGAVACLIRAITPASMYTPHTGKVQYDGVTPIPVAELTLEDAVFLDEIYNASTGSLMIYLQLSGQMQAEAPSFNVMGEITGDELPDQVVVVSSQLDTWDVGQGALSGSGIAMMLEMMRTIKALKVVPRRTLRIVGYTNKENGIRGAIDYATRHGNETIFAVDINGMFGPPQGFVLSNENDNVNLGALKSISTLLKHVGANSVTSGPPSPDLLPLTIMGIPGVSVDFVGANEQYYAYQDSPADALYLIEPSDMNLGTAAIAVMSYCVADGHFAP